MTRHSSLAVLLRSVVAGVAACATAWLYWAWPRSPALAVFGALAILLGHAWALAVEFSLLGFVARGDPAPRASVGDRLRAWANETAAALRVFAWRQPFRWRAVPDEVGANAAAVGVVFIHGFVCNRGFWGPWMRRLQSGKRPFVAINLEPAFAEIDDYVPLVESAVHEIRAATGLPPVLVCHSMGGLVARAWLRTQDVPEAAATRVITIGTPHSGTWLARFSHLANGIQMRRDSPWLVDLNHAMTPRLAQRFTCWYSNCDNVVMPPSTATLAGADNRFEPGAGHVELAFRARVMDTSLALLEDADRAARSSAAGGGPR